MPRVQSGACAVDPLGSRSWAFVVDSMDLCPMFDSDTMEYMMFGNTPKDCVWPYVQGYIEFKERTHVPFHVQPGAQWTVLDDDTLSFMLYIHDYFADVTELGTSPFHQS